MEVPSTGPYANLHLEPRQHPTTQVFLQFYSGGMLPWIYLGQSADLHLDTVQRYNYIRDKADESSAFMSNSTETHTHTHTTVLLLFWNMSGTTRVSRYQKGKTWREIVEKDCRARALNTEDAMVRSRWRK